MLKYAAVCSRQLSLLRQLTSARFVFFSKALSEDLMKMERLESLALWRCDMTADTMRDIAPGLSQQDVC